MADYKGRTRTPYTNALEAKRKADESFVVDTSELPGAITELTKKRGSPAKNKE